MFGGGGVNYANLVENIMKFSICHQDLLKHDRECKNTLFFIWSHLTKCRLWVLAKVQNRSACIIPCFSPINKYMCRYHKQGAGTLTPKTELMALG